MVKNPPAHGEDMGSIPGLGRSPGGGHGDPPSILGREIPWTEEPGRQQPMDMTGQLNMYTNVSLMKK